MKTMRPGKDRAPLELKSHVKGHALKHRSVRIPFQICMAFNYVHALVGYGNAPENPLGSSHGWVFERFERLFEAFGAAFLEESLETTHKRASVKHAQVSNPGSTDLSPTERRSRRLPQGSIYSTGEDELQSKAQHVS